MRKLLVLALATWMTVPGWAAKRITVAQLGEALSIDIAQHRSDEEIARQIAATELSERLTAATLNRFSAAMALQPRTALALQLLADQSAFFDLPADEKLSAEPPSSEDQQKMLAAARGYALATWGRLPNFFVSRVTNRFDNGAQILHAGEYAVRAGLHPVSSSTRQVAFREGKEVLDSPSAGATPGSAANSSDEVGLRSWGEFGPALTVVLSDLASHRLTFSHWERTPGGLAAVYRYEVPREASHYMVTYSWLNTTAIGRTQFGYGGNRRSPQQVASIPKATGVETFHEAPAYHGTLAVDPETGAVLRISIEATLGPGNPLLGASTMIEYGPVTIGDRKFICPVRSLAISLEPGALAGCGKGTAMTMNGVGDLTAWQSVTQHCDNTPVLLINETKFTNYHRLGSTARILTGAAQSGPPPGEVNASTTTAAAPEQNPEPNTASPAAQTAQNTPPAPEAANPAPVETAAASAATAPAPPPEPVIPEVSMSDVKGVPEEPANPGAADPGFSIKVTSRLVDVGVVAFDKKGHPVTDLTAHDFEVFDNGRKQEVRFFTPAPAVAPAAAPEIASSNAGPQQPAFSNRAAEPVSVARPGDAESGATILLVDEGHVAWSDLNYARGQMLQFLEKTGPTERVGLYTMTASGFRVLVEATRDHAALIARLKSFMPSALSLAQAHEEETRNRQQFNEVQNAADLNSVNGNHNDVPDGAQPVDPQLLSMGDDPARASLIILTQVARHLAAVPGHKNLVWVSSDNVFAEWQDQQVGIDKSPKDVRAFAIRVQEAMNDAHTAVYPFDVSQLEGGAIAADIQHRNVELTPAAADNAATAASAGGPAQGAGGRNMQPGRIQAQMSQDLHPIQGTVRDVAAATGGRTIRRTGELAAALNGIVEDGHAIYQLSFSPQGPADDQYHSISIKITGRKGVTLRYRTGYVFAKEAATLKDRFRAAIWRPLDTSEIGVSGDAARRGAMTQVKINITTGDLGMQEQAGRWMDKLDIFFIQRDDAGLHAQLEGQTLGLRLKSSTYQSLLPKGIPFEGAVELREGMSSIRVLVVDENSGRMGSVTIPAAGLKQSD